MEDMEAGSELWVLACARGAVTHTACAPPSRRASYGCLCSGKHVYHAKPALDLGDGFDLLAQGPFQFESESVGRCLFYDAVALVYGPKCEIAVQKVGDGRNVDQACLTRQS